MVNLIHFPDEILLSIIQCILPFDTLSSYTFKDLRNFARVCKRIAPLARRVRVRKIIFYQQLEYKGQRNEREFYNSAEDMARLLELFKTFPGSLHHVQKAYLSWGESCHNELMDQFLRLLSSSTSLQELALALPSQADFKAISTLIRPPKGSFTRLRYTRIDLHTDVLPSDYVVILLETFPCLTHLHVGLSAIGSALDQSQLDMVKQEPGRKTFDLKSLRTDELTKIAHIDLLRLLVPRAPYMATIRMALPQPCVTIDFKDPDIPTIPRQYFSPSTIGQLLTPIAETLEDLCIASMIWGQENSEMVYVSPEDHDNSKIDLSTFTRISKLGLSSYLLFGRHKTAAVEHNAEGLCIDLWSRLPPNIVDLTLYFEGLQGMFVNRVDLTDMWNDPEAHRVKAGGYFHVLWKHKVYDQINEREPIALRWLFEIARRKTAGLFQQLTSIQVRDCITEGAYGNCRPIEIADIYPILADSGLRVSIEIMVPSDAYDGCVGLLRGCGLGGEFDDSEMTTLRYGAAWKWHYLFG